MVNFDGIVCSIGSNVMFNLIDIFGDIQNTSLILDDR